MNIWVRIVLPQELFYNKYHKNRIISIFGGGSIFYDFGTISELGVAGNMNYFNRRKIKELIKGEYNCSFEKNIEYCGSLPMITNYDVKIASKKSEERYSDKLEAEEVKDVTNIIHEKSTLDIQDVFFQIVSDKDITLNQLTLITTYLKDIINSPFYKASCEYKIALFVGNVFLKNGKICMKISILDKYRSLILESSKSKSNYETINNFFAKVSSDDSIFIYHLDLIVTNMKNISETHIYGLLDKREKILKIVDKIFSKEGDIGQKLLLLTKYKLLLSR